MLERQIFLKQKKWHKKQGFTLMETMIGIALMITITLIIYQGFVHMIQFSTYTAIYQHQSNQARSNVNVSLATASSTGSPASENVGLVHGGLSRALGVTKISETPSSSLAAIFLTGEGDDRYFEDQSQVVAMNRHAFVYRKPICPDCGEPVFWYRDASGDYYAYCVDPDCDYDEANN